ncbi:MAG: thioredoxin domain-containing protein [Bifidobacteriaceae bacterium]|jgi:protein-disulfide isomerase|nr:thioredoxin domain-containing protein [Bifidobacteriaceae bacterium]
MASGKKPGGAQTGARNRDAARARAEAERLKAVQAAKERRTKLIAVGAGLVVVVAIVVAVVLVLREATKSNFDEIARPLGANEAGALVIGQDLVVGGAPAEGDGVVVLRVYSDYMCPGCGAVERRLSAKFDELAASGKIKLEIQPVAFLDRFSLGTLYSTRATRAAMTVAQHAPDKFLAFHAKLFASDVQPAENSEGLTDERLVELAQEVGVGEDVTAKFADNEFAEWVDYATDQAQAQPVETTPSLWIGASDSDLTLIENPGAVNLDDAVAAVLAGQDPNG